MNNYLSRKERCVIEMYEAGEGFQAINNRWNVGPSETLRIVGKYRRDKRAEDASKCTNCEWRANRLAICVLPKCFLQN